MILPRLFHRLDDVGADELATAFCETLAQDGMALSIAVVPSWLSADHAKRLALLPRLTVLQHGARHINRQSPGYPDEFPDDMPTRQMRKEVLEGRRRLEDAFERAVLAYVPPWNRASSTLCQVLTELGFKAVSGHSRFPVSGGLRDASASIDAACGYDPLRLEPLPRLVTAIEASQRPRLGVFYHVGGLPKVEWTRAVGLARQLGQLYPVAELMEALTDNDR